MDYHTAASLTLLIEFASLFKKGNHWGRGSVFYLF